MNAQEIVKALTPLADKLGQTATALYAQYYRQAIVNGYLNLMWVAVSLIGIILSIIFTILVVKKADDWDELGFMFGFLAFLVGIASVIVLLTNVNYAIINFNNPGYQATQMLLQQVKGQ